MRLFHRATFFNLKNNFEKAVNVSDRLGGKSNLTRDMITVSNQFDSPSICC